MGRMVWNPDTGQFEEQYVLPMPPPSEPEPEPEPEPSPPSEAAPSPGFAPAGPSPTEKPPTEFETRVKAARMGLPVEVVKKIDERQRPPLPIKEAPSEPIGPKPGPSPPTEFETRVKAARLGLPVSVVKAIDERRTPGPPSDYKPKLGDVQRYPGGPIETGGITLETFPKKEGIQEAYYEPSEQFAIASNEYAEAVPISVEKTATGFVLLFFVLGIE